MKLLYYYFLKLVVVSIFCLWATYVFLAAAGAYGDRVFVVAFVLVVLLMQLDIINKRD